MRSLAVTIIAALMLLSAGSARAQAPAPEAIATARELMAAMRATDQLKTLIPLMLQNMKSAIAQGRPAVEKAYEQLVPLMTKEALDGMESMIEAIAIVYARHFTVEEMRAISAFYTTPVGQKALSRFPVVLQESMVAGEKWGRAAATNLQKRMTEELRKRGHNI